MDLRRLRPGEWVLSAAAIVLLVSLFLPWFTADTGTSYMVLFGDGVTRQFSAWQSYDVLDVVLALCALTALLAVVLQATQRSPALPVLGSVAAGWAGLVAAAIMVWQVLDPPQVFHVNAGVVNGHHLPDVPISVLWGAWIALGAAVGLVAGAWWAIRDDSPGLGVRKSHLESSG